MKASLNLFGTCVLNGTFRSAITDGKMNYLIQNSVMVSPISAIKGTPVRCLYDIEIAGEERARRSIEADINKTVFQRMEKKKANYLVLDMEALRFDILQISDGYDEGLLTYSWAVTNWNKEMFFARLESVCAEYEVVNALNYSEELEEIMKVFCKKILEIYAPEQIIIVHTKPAEEFIDQSGALCRLEHLEFPAKETFLQRGYQYFLDNIPDCHIIEFLSPMLSASYSAWFSHYTKEYYEYVYECINVITDHLPRDEENEKLFLLNYAYSEKMKEVYQKALKKSLERAPYLRYLYAANSYAMVWNGKHAEEGNWLDKLREYHGLKAPCHELAGEGTELFEITGLNEYVDFIKKYAKGHVLLCAVCDSAVRNPEEEGLYDNFKNHLEIGMEKELGIQTSYLLVYDLDRGKLTELWDEDRQEVRYRCAVVLDTGEVMDEEKALKRHSPTIPIYLSSKGREEIWENGELQAIRQWARILIDNIDYAINKRGMNFVLYSKKERCVVDSFYVDSWADESLAIRRN